MILFGRWVLAATVALTLVNCDSCVTVKNNWREKAVEIINKDLAAMIGFGNLSAECDPASENPKAGDSFNCTAKAPDGKILKFVSKMGENGQLFVNVTNVIVKDKIVPVLTTVLPAIKALVGQDVEISNVDCGNKSIVLADDNSFNCVATTPSTGAKSVVRLRADASGSSFKVETEALEPASEDEAAEEVE